jgi:hypothetical protein
VAAVTQMPITILRNHFLRGNNLMLIQGINDQSAESIPYFEGLYSSMQAPLAPHRINPPSIK